MNTSQTSAVPHSTCVKDIPLDVTKMRWNAGSIIPYFKTEHQVKILVKANLQKFIRALANLTRPTAVERSNDFTEIQTISPCLYSSEDSDTEDSGSDNRR